MGSWPFSSAPGHVVSPTASKKDLNKIYYGHSLMIGTGAGRYRGGLVQQLAYGGSDNHGREYDHYAAHQHNMSGGLFG